MAKKEAKSIIEIPMGMNGQGMGIPTTLPVGDLKQELLNAAANDRPAALEMAEDDNGGYVFFNPKSVSLYFVKPFHKSAIAVAKPSLVMPDRMKQ